MRGRHWGRLNELSLNSADVIPLPKLIVGWCSNCWKLRVKTLKSSGFRSWHSNYIIITSELKLINSPYYVLYGRGVELFLFRRQFKMIIEYNLWFVFFKCPAYESPFKKKSNVCLTADNDDEIGIGPLNYFYITIFVIRYYYFRR